MDTFLSKEKKIALIMQSEDFKRLYEKCKAIFTKEALAEIVYDKTILEYEKEFPPIPSPQNN